MASDIAEVADVKHRGARELMLHVEG